MKDLTPSLKVGIVGYGGFGRFLHQSWSRLDEVEVVGIADSNPYVHAGLLDHYRDWESLAAEPDIDIVSIATPPHTHAEIACAAMEAGKHVLIEKPLATSRDDAVRVIEVQARTGRVAAVDYMLRFNPIVEVLQDWAHQKPFGPLRRVIVENYAQDESLAPEHWFWDRASSGGILVEHAVHFIDLVQACVRVKPARVTGCALKRDDGRIDRESLTVVYADGTFMTQYHAFSRPGFFEDTSMRFVFDLAQVDVFGWIPLSGRASVVASKETERELARLPGLADVRRTLVAEHRDTSRPHGPGRPETRAGDASGVWSGGLQYNVGSHVEANFELGVSKSDAYAAALRAMMLDLVRAIRTPDHRLRVPLEDGLSSLDTALRAGE